MASVHSWDFPKLPYYISSPQSTCYNVLMKKPTPAELKEFLSRRVEGIVGEKELRAALTSGKKLTIKYGVDVTAPFLHLGHAVNLWMMRELQSWGHKVIFLIGGFTTKIGDPTGRDETRRQISQSEITKNAKEFVAQVSKVLLTNPSVFEIRNNADWFGRMKTDEFLQILSHTTHAQLIERDMFQKRIKEGKEIRMHELLYPIVQGYDSVMLKSDLTIVGNDQLFNEMMGRFYQERFGQMPQAIITTKITPGLDGKEKQSKSLGNYIAITDSSKDMFGKVMTLPDELIISYFQVYTRLPQTEIAKLSAGLKKGKNPRDAKMLLGHAIAELYHGKTSADTARDEFVNQFQKHELPKNIPTHKLIRGMGLLDLLQAKGLVASKSEGRRLIEQGGVKLDSTPITDPALHLAKGTKGVLQVGKRRFLKLI